MRPNPTLRKPIPDIVPKHSDEDNRHEPAQRWNGDDPEEGEFVVQAHATREVHAEIPGDECEWCEEDRHDREDHHEVVRSGAHGVEDEGGDVGGAGVHLLEGLDHRDAVIEHVSEVGVC